MIVDTNGLSAWWLNEPSFIRHIEQADRLCVPVPALAEFRFGILKSRFRQKMMAWLDDALATTTVLAADNGTPTTMPRSVCNLPPQEHPYL
jgi:predicted nucleic acid-binding protein